MKTAGFAWMMVLCLVARAASATGIDLCSADERVVFSCHIEGSNHIASVCEVSDMAEQRSHLQYRFGSASDRIELAYPTAPTDPATAFKYLWNGYSKGGTSAVSFHIGPWRYSVFSTRSAYASQAGVIVRKGQTVKKYTCATVTNQTSAFFLERLGLPSAKDDVDYVSNEELMTGGP